MAEYHIPGAGFDDAALGMAARTEADVAELGEYLSLGMRRTTLRMPRNLLPDLAIGYRYAEGRFAAEPVWYLNMAPAGNLKATAADMARFTPTAAPSPGTSWPACCWTTTPLPPLIPPDRTPTPRSPSSSCSAPASG